MPEELQILDDRSIVLEVLKGNNQSAKWWGIGMGRKVDIPVVCILYEFLQLRPGNIFFIFQKNMDIILGMK